MDLNTNENPTRRHLLYSIWTLCWCVYYWFISFIVMKWEKRLNKLVDQFVRATKRRYIVTSVQGYLQDFTESEQFKAFISSLLKEQREEVEERMEGLMGKEHAKEMGDNLEMLYGQRQCVICGTNPEKQRELVLSILKGKK